VGQNSNLGHACLESQNIFFDQNLDFYLTKIVGLYFGQTKNDSKKCLEQKNHGFLNQIQGGRITQARIFGQILPIFCQISAINFEILLKIGEL